jgi:hypothetical protein
MGSRRATTLPADIRPLVRKLGAGDLGGQSSERLDRSGKAAQSTTLSTTVDVRTIYIGPYLTEFRGCKPLLSRWVDGVRPRSAHWQSPDGKTLSADELREIEEDWSAIVDVEYAAQPRG